MSLSSPGCWELCHSPICSSLVAALTAVYAQCDAANKNLCSARQTLLQHCSQLFPSLSSHISLCLPAELPDMMCYFVQLRTTLVRSWRIPVPEILKQCVDEFDCDCQVKVILLPPLPGNLWAALCASRKRWRFEAQNQAQSADLKWTQWVQSCNTLSISKIGVQGSKVKF